MLRAVKRHRGALVQGQGGGGGLPGVGGLCGRSVEGRAFVLAGGWAGAFLKAEGPPP